MPLRCARHGQHVEPLPVGQALGGDRVSQLIVDQAEKVGHGHDRLAVLEGNEVLVLYLDPHGAAGVVQVLENDSAAGESFGRAAIDVDDLAAEDQVCAGVVEQLLPSPVGALLDVGETLADFGAVGHRAADPSPPHVSHSHRIAADRIGQAELDDGGPGERLGRLVRRGLEDAHIALLIRNRHRRGHQAVQREHRHLDLGKGSAHSVGVDDRQAQFDGSGDRYQRVDPAYLDGHQRDGFLAQVGGQSPDAGPEFGAGWDLLQDHRRGADDGGGQYAAVVGKFFWLYDRDGSVICNRLLDQQLAHVWVAASAGAEQGRPQREVVDFVNRQLSHGSPSGQLGSSRPDRQT